MKSSKVRELFLKYFEQRNHKILPGSSLVPSDPSILLTTAGMIQFVPYLKGELKPENTRITTVQRCVRTTDIENVGHTARHLTFFEMLGNFSIGDYFKEEAIAWAWEFIVEELNIEEDKLWISIYKDDDEAYKIWNKQKSLDKKRIVRLEEDENFWSMGPTGPCGPCSEILYDFGEHLKCGADCQAGCDCDRFLEIWNLVFMQFNRDEKGNLSPLPSKNIDTGMGLERISAVMQDVDNVFETDLIKPVIDRICKIGGCSFGKDNKTDTSVKIIADHGKAITFMVNDGIMPSNEGRGYVLRRLLRRALRHGQRIGISNAFLKEIAEVVIKSMDTVYSDVKKNQKYITEIIDAEERQFDKTLRQGIVTLEEFIDKAKKANKKVLDEEVVFRLYDTYGFPIELTQEIAVENKLGVDEKGFLKLMEQHKEKARTKSKFITANTDIKNPNIPYIEILNKYGKTKFVGYAQNEIDTKIHAILVDSKRAKKADKGTEVDIVLGETPFYAEMGGQAGDMGIITAGEGIVEVKDTFSPVQGIYMHHGRIVKGQVRQGQKATAKIDVERRSGIKRNHTGTHLLHWALQMVLGEHVRQSGSMVEPHRFRFDFSHGKQLSKEERIHIESLVNKKILENHGVKSYTTTYQFATESGAVAIFGEKYGKYVRVLEVGDFSRELCGGTHVIRTGDIGQLKILSEASVGANVRRIEAITGMDALKYSEKMESDLGIIEKVLKVGRADIHERLDNIVSQLKEKDHQLNKMKAKISSSEGKDFLETSEKIGKTALVSGLTAGRTMEELRIMADEIRNQTRSAVIIVGSDKDGSANLLIAATSDLAGEKVNADEIIKVLGPIISGGGGGRADLAQAGGKEATKLKDAIDKGKEIIRDCLL